MNPHIHRVTALNYFGGKSRYLDWILPILNIPHTGYLEPYCGSAVVFLNKKQASIEVINDLDGRLINFFKILRDRPSELIGKLELTPYSRGEFIECLNISEDPLENARQFFVRSLQSFAGICDTERRKYSWRAASQENREGVSLEISKWFGKIYGLREVVDKLLTAVIENRPALEVINRFKDYPSYLIYCDPPYLPEVRYAPKDYLHEMTIEQHQELANILQNAKAKVAISHYDCQTYDTLYQGWQKHLGPSRNTNLGKKSKKREVIYTNYFVSHQPEFGFTS